MDNDILQEVYDKEMTQYRRLIKNTFKCPAIYVITNNIDGKQYVGCCRNLEDTVLYYKKSNGKARTAFQKAMDEDGIDNFSCEVFLHPDKDSNTLLDEANRLILELNTLKPNGYNNSLRHPNTKRNKKNR